MVVVVGVVVGVVSGSIVGKRLYIPPPGGPLGADVRDKVLEAGIPGIDNRIIPPPFKKRLKERWYLPAPLGAGARGKALAAVHPGIVSWTNPPETFRREGHLFI